MFQHRLDETSGLLSEQKIKSSELEKNLEQCRKDYDNKIFRALDDHRKSQFLLKNELTGFKDIIKSNSASGSEDIKALIATQTSEIDTKIDNLQERYPYFVSKFPT